MNAKKFPKLLLLALFLISALVAKADTIFINTGKHADPQCTQNAINQIEKRKGKPMVVKLRQANYPLYREYSSHIMYREKVVIRNNQQITGF